MNTKTISILVSIAALLAIAAYSISRPNSTQAPGSGVVVFPRLSNSINEIDKIEIATNQTKYQLVRKENTWVSPANHGYIVDTDKVRKLLLSTLDLKTIEVKTSNPELYAKLGLQDISSDTSKAVQLQFHTGDKVIVDLLLGNSKPSKMGNQQGSAYIRKPNEARSWLATPKIKLETAPADWLEKTIVDIKSQQIQTVVIEHPDKETVHIAKDSPEAKQFSLHGINADEKLKSDYALNSIAQFLEDLKLEDVVPEKESLLNPENTTKVTFTTFAGMIISASLSSQDDRSLLKLSAQQRPKTDETATKDKQASDKQPPEISARTLNERLKGWVYVIPKYRMNNAVKRRSDLVEAAAQAPATPLGLSTP